ncbi:MAG: ABC transporter substrate-binding protein, partial [Alphaproteobacteria bacterium]|nr:ABC transporter substrate-binding protein [Alphaproteobacteria bacterium]
MRFLTYSAACAFAMAQPISAQSVAPSDWPAVLEQAQGQTVYWHAWGGDPRINAFIAQVGDVLSERHGVTLEHVRLADTADAVTRVVSER